MSATRNRPSKHQAPTPRRRRALAALALPLAVGAIALCMIGGVTHARWASNDTFSGGTVTGGDLRVSTGAMTWRQTTPGVTNPASGTLGDAPSGFVAMPGDVVEISVPVTTVLHGQNLTAELTADYLAPASTGADIAVTYRVENEAGQQIAPATGTAPVTDPLTISGLAGDPAGADTHWTVVLRVAVVSDYQWITPDQPAQTTDFNAGKVRVTLTQTRSSGTDPGGGA
ncbi:MAG: hypothetical protein FWD74_00085 [Actinomycetia bacterium]|nr:hypothetical protein [Actinomycetes bacterium]